MNYDKLEQYLSVPRVGRYLAATGNSKEKALKLYRINLRTAQAFYPVLNLFEVVFRNVLYEKVAAHFSDPDWILSEKNGFMSDRSLRASRYFLKKSVEKAESSIIRVGGTVTAGKIVAEQSLGFWTSLFEPHHYRLIGGVPIQCFPGKPAQENRSSISQKLGDIRKFRNRIYHNEPICFNGTSPDFGYATAIKLEVFRMVRWISPELEDYISYFDAVDSKISLLNRL